MRKHAPLVAALLAVLPGVVQAQPDAHYVPGIEGIKCATLPPPGFYIRDYNVLYAAQDLNNGAGHNAGPPNLQALVYANVPRAIYISDYKVLGGYLGGDLVLPFTYTSLSYKGYSSSSFGPGDFYGEGTLSWHPGQFDIGFAAGFWAPTGAAANDAAGRATLPGSGFWTPELTLGATYYLDAEKTWAISALNRYEFNTKDREADVHPGQAWTVEWGMSKSLTKQLDLGLVGYYQTRTTPSTGTAASLFPYSRVVAIGPEAVYEIPSVKLFVSLRYNYELMAENRMQGHTVALVLTKAF